MKQVNVKKLILPNIPYVFIALLATKVSEAVRLAPGSDASTKLLNIMTGLNTAFHSLVPSFHPIDLCVGVAAAIAIRLAVYIKGKNAKKFRKNLEYGSARWGTAEDIKPYVDPAFENNIILTQTERLTMNSRPKDPKTARNKNVLIVGGSGSGKTRFWLKPNLLQCTSKTYPTSFVVTDPKGDIVVSCGHALQKNGYQIKILNSLNFKKSMHYNPFAYIHSEKDILKLVTTLIANTKGEGKAGDDFWVKAETLLYTALIGYIHYEAPVEEQNFSTLIEFINAMEVREDDEDFKNPVDLMFDELKKRKPDHFAVRQYAKFKLSAGKTAKSILISCGARLAPFDIQELRELTAYDELQLDTLGDRKTALFIIMSDTDDTFNFLISINYQLSQNEDKTAIFEAWCDFLNYFDSSVQFQLSFVNLSASQETFARSISIPPCGDEFDGIRAEYAGMLQNQLARGNNGLIKTKYLTFGVEADNLRAAKPRLERIETDLLNNFKRLGVVAAPLNGFERLHVMHDILRMDEQEPFRFSWDWLAPSGLSTKDFIAPSSFEFKTGRMFRMGKKLGAISFVQILAPELNDRMLADFLDMESSVLVNLHVQSVDQVNAIKTVKRKITDLDKSKIEEQKKAVRAGYDMDIIPSDLATYGAEAKKLLQDLQSRNERMFLLTFLILNTADTPRQLDNNIFQTSSIAQKYNCALTRLDFQQEEGLMSSLPLGLNQIEIQRGLTTSSVAIFVPFTTQELFQNGSEALYYGINALSNNLIMVDRKLLKNPNGLILGTPGSGKSFSAKREITNAFLICPKDDIIICDPEGEYTPLVERLHGQVIKLSPTGKGYDGSPCYINPMDLNLDYSDDDNPLSLKSDFILSLCELIVGGKDGLAPVEKTIIDRCVRIVYLDYLNDPKPENMPLLEDLYNALRAQDEKEAQYIATALEIYVTGSLNVFNHHTNVDVNSRIVCYDIKELGKQLKKIGMLVVQDQVWNRVTINRAAHKTTRYYLDEFHLLLKEEQTASYSVEIWKRYRKWGGIPTGITQNVKDLLSSREVENIFENSDFIYMLNQAAGDRQILAKQLNISPHQLSYVTHSGEGEGLLFYGNTILPFIDHFPKDTELYRVMTTKPQEVTSA